MSIDVTGVTPGILKEEVKIPTINMKCRNPKCDSIVAVEVLIPNSDSTGHRIYRCTKCNHTYGVAVGGTFVI
jgi:hypothetical protein